MSLEQYFQREDTPAAGSPTGRAIVALLALRPTISFDDARRLVNDVGASLYSTNGCAKAAAQLWDAETTTEHVQEHAIAAA